MGYRGLWRGKREDNGKWVEGYHVRYPQGKGAEPLHIIIGLGGQYNRVDPKTLGECTGLRDRNGKPIFEGDICTVATPNIADDEYGVIKYDNEAVFIVDFGTYTINFCDNINSSAVEVIGNIHDNPELLEGGK